MSKAALPEQPENAPSPGDERRLPAGGRQVVRALALAEATLTPVVVYEDFGAGGAPGRLKVRPTAEWLARPGVDGPLHEAEHPEGAPEAGAVHRHYKGGRYRVLALAFSEPESESVVLYQKIHEDGSLGAAWVRATSDWLGTAQISTKHDGCEVRLRRVPRFRAEDAGALPESDDRG